MALHAAAAGAAVPPSLSGLSSNTRFQPHWGLRSGRDPGAWWKRRRPLLTVGSSPPSPSSSPGCVRALSASNSSLETNDSPLTVCFGEMLIDFVPTTSGLSLAEAPAFKKAPGGAPANVAVGIARLGGLSAFIGKVGDDEFGYMLADILKENNVNNQGMRFDPAARTALAFVTLRSDGEREFMFYRNPSADMLLQEGELDLAIIRKATIFHYGSISLITEPCKSAHIAAAKAAKDAGVLLSYDPNLRLPLWPSVDSARDGILSIWDIADIIKISEEEISFLTRGENPYDDDVVRKLFHPNLKLLLVTEGPNGCRYYTKDFNGRVSGLKVDQVDTTGAGDAFVAGILSELANDTSLLQDSHKPKQKPIKVHTINISHRRPTKEYKRRRLRRGRLNKKTEKNQKKKTKKTMMKKRSIKDESALARRGGNEHCKKRRRGRRGVGEEDVVGFLLFCPNTRLPACYASDAVV